MSLRNWKHFQWPFAPLQNFTRSEPFPSREVKPTFIDGRRRPRRMDMKLAFQAMVKRGG